MNMGCASTTKYTASPPWDVASEIPVETRSEAAPVPLKSDKVLAYNLQTPSRSLGCL